MMIQFNTDNNIKGTEELRAPLEEKIEKSLSRFSERITRVEVHLNDENGHKTGGMIRCMLESILEHPTCFRHNKMHNKRIKVALIATRHGSSDGKPEY